MRLTHHHCIKSSLCRVPSCMALLITGLAVTAFVPCGQVVGGEAAPDTNQSAKGVSAPAAPDGAVYTSSGLVEVTAKEVGDLQIEQETQARLLLHRRLLGRVLERSEEVRKTQWFKQFVNTRDGQQQVDAPAALDDLLKHFQVVVIPRSRLLEVRMSSPSATDCQTIIHEIVDQHIKDQREAASLVQVERENSLEQFKLNYEAQLRDCSGRMVRIAAELGSAGISIGHGPDSKALELQQLLSEQFRASSVFGAADARLKTFDGEMETNSAPELEEVLVRNPIYAHYRQRAEDLQDAYADLAATLEPKDPKLIAVKFRLDAMQQKLDNAENDAKARTAEVTRAKLQNDRSAAESALTRVSQRLTDIRAEISDLAQKRNEYERLQSDVNRLAEKLDKVKDEQDKIGYLTGYGKVSPVSWAAYPDLPDLPGTGNAASR